jgi:hypothetical protein
MDHPHRHVCQIGREAMERRLGTNDGKGLAVNIITVAEIMTHVVLADCVAPCMGILYATLYANIIAATAGLSIGQRQVVISYVTHESPRRNDPMHKWLSVVGIGEDGQLTKGEVRAMTQAALAPIPSQLLWDVGAGCGSIGIE